MSDRPYKTDKEFVEWMTNIPRTMEQPARESEQAQREREEKPKPVKRNPRKLDR